MHSVCLHNCTAMLCSKQDTAKIAGMLANRRKRKNKRETDTSQAQVKDENASIDVAERMAEAKRRLANAQAAKVEQAGDVAAAEEECAGPEPEPTPFVRVFDPKVCRSSQPPCVSTQAQMITWQAGFASSTSCWDDATHQPSAQRAQVKSGIRIAQTLHH